MEFRHASDKTPNGWEECSIGRIWKLSISEKTHLDFGQQPKESDRDKENGQVILF